MKSRRSAALASGRPFDETEELSRYCYEARIFQLLRPLGTLMDVMPHEYFCRFSPNLTVWTEFN